MTNNFMISDTSELAFGRKYTRKLIERFKLTVKVEILKAAISTLFQQSSKFGTYKYFGLSNHCCVVKIFYTQF